MKHEIIATGIFDCRVCSEGTWDQALEWLKKNSPAGTKKNWMKNNNSNFEPTQCADDPKRTHYMFET